MKKLRKQLIIWLFEVSKTLYTALFKKAKPWGIYKAELLTYPDASFGKHLGLFLESNNFELIPKVERHDAYHVLTNYGVNVEDEIALQYVCLGNGKKNIYLYGTVIIGTILLPDYLGYYHKSYQLGKKANKFHHLNYKNLLKTPFNDFRNLIFKKD